jgi:hypothetical protein
LIKKSVRRLFLFSRSRTAVQSPRIASLVGEIVDLVIYSSIVLILLEHLRAQCGTKSSVAACCVTGKNHLFTEIASLVGRHGEKVVCIGKMIKSLSNSNKEHF